MDVDDANFTCPVGSVRCDVTVSDDGIVTSVGGTATAKNSDGVMTTMTAIALYTALTATWSNRSPVIDRRYCWHITDMDFCGKQHDRQSYDYAGSQRRRHHRIMQGKAVDSGHEIDGWDSQTLTRDSGTTRKPKLEEATVYTNIEPATGKKLRY